MGRELGKSDCCSGGPGLREGERGGGAGNLQVVLADVQPVLAYLDGLGVR